MSRWYSDAEVVEVWDRRQAGESNRSIGRRLGRSGAAIRALMGSTGGVKPRQQCWSSRQLSLSEREEISRGLAAGDSIRTIASRLGRAPSTVSRELARNGGRRSYRAHTAEKQAWVRARRPQVCKLAANPRLRAVVEAKLQVPCHLSRSHDGLRILTVALRRCRCPTKRSMSRCSSRPEAA